jgi:hypothetical protein
MDATGGKFLPSQRAIVVQFEDGPTADFQIEPLPKECFEECALTRSYGRPERRGNSAALRPCRLGHHLAL